MGINWTNHEHQEGPIPTTSGQKLGADMTTRNKTLRFWNLPDVKSHQHAYDLTCTFSLSAFDRRSY